MEWPADPSIRDAVQQWQIRPIRPGITLSEALESLCVRGPGAVLEEDRIRILPRAEATDFWRKRWAGQKGK